VHRGHGEEKDGKEKGTGLKTRRYNGLTKGARGSWFGVGCGVGVAAGILCGSVVHDFDAGEVGVVDVERVFTVAANFGAVEFCGAVDAKMRRGIVGVFYAKRKMILHAAFLFVSARGNVQHEFDPLLAVGNLDFVPIVFLRC